MSDILVWLSAWLASSFLLVILLAGVAVGWRASRPASGGPRRHGLIEARCEVAVTERRQPTAAAPVDQSRGGAIAIRRPAFMARQGDVLIMSHSGPIRGSPVSPEAERIVLAKGKAPGRQHSFHDSGRIAFFRDDGLARAYLLVESEPARLEHPEHDAITVPPGIYEVRRQREYPLSAIRTAAATRTAGD